MNHSLSILLGAVALALVASACGGKVMGSPNTGGSGGTGAGPAGGTGAMPYGGAPAGGAPAGGYGGGPVAGHGGVPAGGYGGIAGYGGGPAGYGGMPMGGYGGTGGGPSCVGCKSYTLAGGIEMKACCTPMGTCGGLVDATMMLGLPPGCFGINQPGKPDGGCQPGPWSPTSPTGGFQGCCHPMSGTCGFYADFTSLSGPNFGCADSGQVTGGQPPYPCATTGNCYDELFACMGNSQCASLLQCLQPCAESQCASKCYQSYPGGQAAFNALQACEGPK